MEKIWEEKEEKKVGVDGEYESKIEKGKMKIRICIRVR